MFYCDSCNVLSKPGNKCFKTPLETRQKVYNHPKMDPTYGYETVIEQNLCAICYEKYLKVYQEKERIEKEQQEKIIKEHALQNVRIPVMIPRLVKTSGSIRALKEKFNNRRR